ncbi:hypothetical protein MHYP_G00242340 [Metynnis hypsauchen]
MKMSTDTPAPALSVLCFPDAALTLLDTHRFKDMLCGGLAPRLSRRLTRSFVSYDCDMATADVPVSPSNMLEPCSEGLQLPEASRYGFCMLSSGFRSNITVLCPGEALCKYAWPVTLCLVMLIKSKPGHILTATLRAVESYLLHAASNTSSEMVHRGPMKE